MDGEVNREKKMEVKPFQDGWMDGQMKGWMFRYTVYRVRSKWMDG